MVLCMIGGLGIGAIGNTFYVSLFGGAQGKGPVTLATSAPILSTTDGVCMMCLR